jgi:hypothetical protein
MRCNLDDPTEYTQVKLDYEGDLSLHSTSANKQIQIEALDIESKNSPSFQKTWLVENEVGGAANSGIPNRKRCFRKDNFIVQIYKSTERCNANSPCHVYDGFAVIFYIPKVPPGAP